MTLRDNKQIVAAFYDNVAAGRAQEAFASLAPDFRFELIAPPPHGGVYDREGLGRFFMEVMVPPMAAPFVVTVTGMTAEDDRVAVETISDCVNTKNVVYKNRYHTLFVIRDGQIAVMKEYLDSAHLLQFLDV